MRKQIMMMDMASADQIAERARSLARAAVDDLAQFSDGEVSGLREAQMRLATNRPTDEEASRRRKTPDVTPRSSFSWRLAGWSPAKTNA